MAKGKLEEFLVNQDVFGHKIGVHYRGKDTYQTRLGAFLTIVTYSLMFANFIALFGDFLEGSR